MKILFLLLTILNMIFISTSDLNDEYPQDTSEDILTEGISDPTYIVEQK